VYVCGCVGDDMSCVSVVVVVVVVGGLITVDPHLFRY